MVDISVVIVNYKMKEFIREALTTLYRDVEGGPMSVQVVVVDNNSDDGVGEMLASEFPHALFLQNGANLGFGAACNNGMRAVEANYYFLLNPDTRFTESRTIERLWRFMEENPRAGLCAPRLMNFDGTLQHSCCRFPSLLVPLFRRTRLGNLPLAKRATDGFLMKDWNHGKYRLVEWVIGSAMFARATAIAKVGLMDERFFMYFEDTDWCRRFWEAGWPVYYVADVSLQHAHQRASAKMSVWRGLFLNRTTQYHIKSWMKYLLKYRGARL
jgi:hypothetical protein